ncbi:MAG: hypothetical protein Q7J25_10630 [Vicinamibacterales bacterium]|nr:hypothetical protein [Vicinamibacterales bacterium]
MRSLPLRPSSWILQRPAALAFLQFAAIFSALSVIHHDALLHSRPFWGDNLLILEWAARTPWQEILHGDPRYPLEFRPIPHLVMWTEYQLWGVAPVFPYLLFNLTAWAGAVWLTYRISQRLTRHMTGAIIGTAFLITARSSHTITLYLMGRQTGLACLFGMAAVYFVFQNRSPGLRRTVLLFALLMASALSKEYGLAFCGGIALWGLRYGRLDYSRAALAALGVYAGLRMLEYTPSLHCEVSGYFGGDRTICFEGINVTVLTQAAWNASVSLMQTVLPGFFSAYGTFEPDPGRLLRSTFWLALLVPFFRRAPALAALAALVIATNAALNVPLFRSRNTMVGLTILAVGISIGFDYVETWCRARRTGTLRLVVVAALIVVALRSITTIERIERDVLFVGRQDPCSSLEGLAYTGPGFIRQLKLAYGMPNPECAGPIPGEVP